jgi:BCD family chlorophyll transporter-like MFS transporter
MALGGVIRDVVAQCVQWGWLGEPLMGPATAYSFVYHIEIYLLFVVLVALGPMLRASRLAQRAANTESTPFGLAQLPG